MKLLLYCTKSKPNLYVNRCVLPTEFDRYILSTKKQYYSAFGEPLDKLNGKIVAECDFMVEKIIPVNVDEYEENYDYGLPSGKNLLEKSCLSTDNICEYLEDYNGETIFKKGYAIHIKNLHIFNEPKELADYSKRLSNGDFQVLGNAPQNMMECCELKYMVEDYILISIQPKWLRMILNGEKTIEIRKKVLKEMLKK